ncbi:MAG TPA: hypothetical protein DCR08_03070 [Lactobacillus sp.]|nr:hypothetical protein [Lactobacillus sp.]
MFDCFLVVNGQNTGNTVSLPKIPSMGDVISNVDAKKPCYLVLRVEYVDGFDSVNLHVKEFANQIDASVNINGFR